MIATSVVHVVSWAGFALIVAIAALFGIAIGLRMQGGRGR